MMALGSLPLLFGMTLIYLLATLGLGLFVSTISATQLNLFRLLRRKARLALGPDIASFFRELVDEERGVARAVVTSAVELDDDRRSALARRLAEQTGKQVTVETQVDPSILGGLIANYLPARGDFDAWSAASDGGGALDLASLDLIQRRTAGPSHGLFCR